MGVVIRTSHSWSKPRFATKVGDAYEISLSTGDIATVDAVDVEKVNSCNWSLHRGGEGKPVYARGKPYWSSSKVYMHRLILCFPFFEVDHKNGNGLDNRRCNLRAAINGGNQCNRRGVGGASKHKGVYLNRQGKWCAQIAKCRQRYCLGTFDSEVEAAIAYNDAAIRLHGEFAKLNEV